MSIWPPVLWELLKPLHPHLNDALVTDILIDGVDCVWIERSGAAKQKLPGELASPRELEAMIHFLRKMGGAHADGEHVTVRLPDGSRVHAIGGGLAHRGRGPWITIRRFRRSHLGPDQLVAGGGISAEQLQRLIADLVVDHRNILCAGPTGSGKTTFAEVLLRQLPAHERVLIMQDIEEIVPPTEDSAWGSFQPGVGGYEALLASLLRMQPDRLVLGECRGPEAWTLLDALTTGHEGGVTTVHAHAPAVALRRLESLSLQHPNAPDLRAIRARVADAIHIVVQLVRERHGESYRRYVKEIADVVGLDEHGGYVLRTRWTSAAGEAVEA